MDDLISRQMAIDVLMEILDRPNHAEFLYTDEICRALGSLPSAQPDLSGYSDRLWRNAYERGKQDARIECLRTDYQTDHGYIWLCPRCGTEIHSDFDRCVRCGYER